MKLREIFQLFLFMKKINTYIIYPEYHFFSFLIIIHLKVSSQSSSMTLVLQRHAQELGKLIDHLIFQAKIV